MIYRGIDQSGKDLPQEAPRPGKDERIRVAQMRIRLGGLLFALGIFNSGRALEQGKLDSSISIPVAAIVVGLRRTMAGMAEIEKIMDGE